MPRLTCCVFQLPPPRCDTAACGDDLRRPTCGKHVGRRAGVPLFALELARVVAEAPDTSDLPDTLRRAIAERIARLPADARRVVEVAAVLGEAFEVRALAALAEVPAAGAVALTEELVARRLLEESQEPAGSYAFVHDLIRRASYDGLGQTRRR